MTDTYIHTQSEQVRQFHEIAKLHKFESNCTQFAKNIFAPSLSLFVHLL